jgi:hypothetical protein
MTITFKTFSDNGSAEKAQEARVWAVEKQSWLSLQYTDGLRLPNEMFTDRCKHNELQYTLGHKNSLLSLDLPYSQRTIHKKYTFFFFSSSNSTTSAILGLRTVQTICSLVLQLPFYFLIYKKPLLGTRVTSTPCK